ncbi:MAG: sigma-54-dependent transcriptional regulator [Deferribacterales bacterium]
MHEIGVSVFKIFNDPREFISSAYRIRAKIIFVKSRMTFSSCDEIIDIIKDKMPLASVIVISEEDETDETVRYIRKGAVGFIIKPISFSKFKTGYLTAMNSLQNGISSEIVSLEDSSLLRYAFEKIITVEDSVRTILKYLSNIARSDYPVLITGETGVGKELFAEAVHRASGRKGSYVAVNISGLDDTMFTDTLFGHSKGAFTGAERNRKGLVAEAERGTLFLDEIGDLNEGAQVKLLRLLQEKVYMPLGMDKNVHANVRIIAATNIDLKQKIKQGRFRQDLLFRLSTHCITIPPLRERRNDIGILALQFYNKALKESGYEETDLLPEGVEEILVNYIIFRAMCASSNQS